MSLISGVRHLQSQVPARPEVVWLALKQPEDAQYRSTASMGAVAGCWTTCLSSTINLGCQQSITAHVSYWTSLR